MGTILRAAVVYATLMMVAAPVCAQETEAETVAHQLPPGWIAIAEPGLFREPTLLSKLALSTETTIGGSPRDGFYMQTGTMITGSGWISAGPGYRRAMLHGNGQLDLSAALSSNLYKVAQASFQLPRLARGKLSIGVQTRYQDALQVNYFGLGNDSRRSERSAYRLNSLDVSGSGGLRLNRLLSIDGAFGWLPRTDLLSATGPRVTVPNTVDLFSEATAPGLRTQPAFLHSDVSVVASSLDYSGHPTTGGMYRATAAAYVDRGTGAYSFRRYEIEAAQCVPLGTRKWVLALHAWEVFSDASAGRTVPFYLMPSLGGNNTLRGLHDYRFHDNHMQIVNVESRLALLTHMDLAVFADAGKVARDVSDLDFRHAKVGYGAGIRFHNATSTLLRIDAGHGVEGWRVGFKTSDSFKRSTPASGRPAVAPFVP